MILSSWEAGAENPAILVLGHDNERYQQALTVAYLGACQALWQPLEAREYHGSSIEPIQSITMVGEFDSHYAHAIAMGQYTARDLCGTEPERMAPP